MVTTHQFAKVHSRAEVEEVWWPLDRGIAGVKEQSASTVERDDHCSVTLLT